MENHSSAQVVSRVPYVVTDVAGRPPGSLADFTGSMRFTAVHDHTECDISGVGAAATDDRVRFSEKADGTGKDVRVWQITRSAADNSYQACTVSTF